MDAIARPRSPMRPQTGVSHAEVAHGPPNTKGSVCLTRHRRKIGHAWQCGEDALFCCETVAIRFGYTNTLEGSSTDTYSCYVAHALAMQSEPQPTSCMYTRAPIPYIGTWYMYVPEAVQCSTQHSSSWARYCVCDVWLGWLTTRTNHVAPLRTMHFAVESLCIHSKY